MRQCSMVIVTSRITIYAVIYFSLEIVTLSAIQRWPTAEIPNFKRVVVECFEVCSKLALRVLLAIANGLNMKVCQLLSYT